MPETTKPAMTTAEKYNRLRGHQTLWELAITNPDGRSYLICYADRKSRNMLLKAVRHDNRALKLVALTGAEEITFATKAADGATMGGWSIQWTGDTQRDAITRPGGELPYVGTLEIPTGD